MSAFSSLLLAVTILVVFLTGEYGKAKPPLEPQVASFYNFLVAACCNLRADKTIDQELDLHTKTVRASIPVPLAC